MGRMARKASEIPIEISPTLNCRWRWLNSKALACQLDETSAFAPATSYNIVVHPGIKSQDGATLEKPFTTSFTTVRPKVRNVWFKTWSAPGMPVIRLTFNQPVFESSVAEHIFFVLKGRENRQVGAAVSMDPDVKEKPLRQSTTGPQCHGPSRLADNTGKRIADGFGNGASRGSRRHFFGGSGKRD